MLRGESPARAKKFNSGYILVILTNGKQRISALQSDTVILFNAVSGPITSREFPPSNQTRPSFSTLVFFRYLNIFVLIFRISTVIKI